MKCSQCHTELSEDANFCIKCGVIVRCRFCGYNKINLEARFCPNCGKSFNISDQSKGDDESLPIKLLPSLVSIENEIKVNIHDAIKFSFKNKKIAKLLDSLINEESIIAIRDELKNKELVKKEFLSFIDQIHDIKNNLYRDLLACLLLDGQRGLLAFNIKKKKNESIVEFKKKEVFNNLDILYHQLYINIETIKENNPGFGDYLRRGVIFGGVLLGSALFPNASRIAFCVLENTETHKSVEQKVDVKAAIYNINSIKNKILLEIDTIFDIMLEEAIDNIAEKFQTILKIYFEKGFIDLNDNELDSKLNEFLDKLKVKISGFNSIKEDILSFDESFTKSLESGQFKQIYDYLQSDEDKTKMLKSIYNRNDDLYKELKSWEWWSFDNPYQTSQYFKKQVDNDFNSIINKFQINSTFESFFLMCNSSLFCKGSNKNFDAKKIINFVKNFNSLEINQIKIYFDLTIFGGGDEGFAFTDTSFYYNENDIKVEISLYDIILYKHLRGTSINIEYYGVSRQENLKIELGFLDKKYIVKFVELLNIYFRKC